MVANQVMDVASKVYDATAKKAMDYGVQVRGLAMYTGMTTEETSKLIQVSDDLKVEFGTLEMAAKFMFKNGLQPSVETLAQLSDKYLAISDPLKRAEFLTKNFGKAGMDMAEAMNRGGDAIRAMGAAVEPALILTKEQAQAAEDARAAQDSFNDAILAASVAIGNSFLPALTAAVTEAIKWVEFMGKGVEVLGLLLSWQTKLQEAVDKQTEANIRNASSYEDLITRQIDLKVSAGQLSAKEGELLKTQLNLALQYESGALEADDYAISTADVAKQVGMVDKATYNAIGPGKVYAGIVQLETAKQNEFNDALERGTKGSKKYALELYNVWEATNKGTVSVLDYSSSLATIPGGAELAAQALKNLADQQAANKKQIDNVKNSFSALTKEMIYNRLAAYLDAEGQLALARQMGLLNEDTYRVLSKLDDLTREFDKNGDGALDASEKTTEYKNKLAALLWEMQQIQSKDVTVTVNIEANMPDWLKRYLNFNPGAPGNDTGGGADHGWTDPVTGIWYPKRPSGKAGGGMVYPSMGYPVGERGVEWFRPQSNGIIIPNNVVRNYSNSIANKSTVNKNYNLSVITNQSQSAVTSSFGIMRLIG
jgi:hypothetical protein